MSALNKPTSIRQSTNSCYIYVNHFCPKFKIEKVIYISSSIRTLCYDKSELKVHCTFYDVIEPSANSFTTHSYWWSTFLFARDIILGGDERMVDTRALATAYPSSATSSSKLNNELQQHMHGLQQEELEDCLFFTEVEEIDDCVFASPPSSVGDDETITSVPLSSYSPNQDDSNVDNNCGDEEEEEVRNGHRRTCYFKDDPFGPFSTCCSNIMHSKK
jgi:hypothetical protein